MYSNVDCGGWESDIQECMKSNHLQIQCSHSAVAGVMCSDGRCDKLYNIIIIIYYIYVIYLYNYISTV